jgi:hypothetical protein
MKSLILLGAVAAALVALTASASSAPAAKQAKEAKEACSFASLPRASTVREQSLYGRIKSLARKGARFELRFDPAWLLTGYTASRAAREDTGSGEVPNDSYTRDETHKLLAYLVPANAKVTILTHGTCSTHVTMARLARAVPTAGFWIQVRNDVVTSIDQQYHP